MKFIRESILDVIKRTVQKSLNDERPIRVVELNRAEWVELQDELSLKSGVYRHEISFSKPLGQPVAFNPFEVTYHAPETHVVSLLLREKF